MPAPRSRPRQVKLLDAGIFQPEISSFRLHLAAEGKAAKTIRTYTEAVQWFAAAHLSEQVGRGSWDQVTGQDIERWLAAEEQLLDPMAGLRPPKVTEKLVPVFTAGNWRRWSRRARAAGSRSGAMPRSSRCSARPASGCPSWPGSGTAHGVRYPRPPVDYSSLATANGAHRVKVAKPAELARAIREALAHPGPALVDVDVIPGEPPLPGKAEYEQAGKSALAFLRDRPREAAIAAARLAGEIR